MYLQKLPIKYFLCVALRSLFLGLGVGKIVYNE